MNHLSRREWNRYCCRDVRRAGRPIRRRRPGRPSAERRRHWIVPGRKRSDPGLTKMTGVKTCTCEVLAVPWARWHTALAAAALMGGRNAGQPGRSTGGQEGTIFGTRSNDPSAPVVHLDPFSLAADSPECILPSLRPPPRGRITRSQVPLRGSTSLAWINFAGMDQRGLFGTGVTEVD